MSAFLEFSGSRPNLANHERGNAVRKLCVGWDVRGKVNGENRLLKGIAILPQRARKCPEVPGSWGVAFLAAGEIY